MKWIKVKSSECQSFKYSDEPEMIHVIKTGFEDKYIVVFEDAFEYSIGDTFIGTKEEVESKFNISLDTCGIPTKS